MSEFSDSCHLRGKRQADAIRLLVTAKVPGYAFEESQGWAPFVFPVGSRVGPVDNLERIVAANTGLLVRYEYAEDHGCTVTVYEGTARVAVLKVSFESTKPGRFDRDAFINRGLVTESGAAEIERWVKDLQRSRGLLIVAGNLGLPRHELFSFNYVDRNQRGEGIEVKPDGTVVGAEDAPEEALAVEGGPWFALAVALVDKLVAAEAIELRPGADPRRLAEDLDGALANLLGRDPVVAIRDVLIDHDSVEELFADDASLSAMLGDAGYVSARASVPR